MPSYQDIGEAFGQYCDTCWRIRDAAFDWGKMIFAAIAAKGQIPHDAFKPHPPHTPRLNLSEDFIVQDSMRYNADTGVWEFGTFLLGRSSGMRRPIL